MCLDIGQETLDTAALQLSTEVVNLDEYPEYTALSYTWGNPFTVFPNPQERDRQVLDSYTILLDGAFLHVGENLYRYLLGWRINIWHLDPSSDMFFAR